MSNKTRIEWYERESSRIDSLDLTNQLDQQEFKNLVKGYLKLTAQLFNFIEDHRIIAEESPEFSLEQGKYKGGVDIPCGSYDLEVIPANGNTDGNALIDCKKPDNTFFFLYLKDAPSTYMNFEVTEKSYVKIQTHGVKVVFRKHQAMI